MRGLMKKMSKGLMCLVWLMSSLKKLPMVCFLSKYSVIVFIAKEVVKQQVNAMYVQALLSSTMILGQKVDGDFLLTKKPIDQLPIWNLFDQVKTRSVVLNLCYLVSDHASNDIIRTENFGEIFFEIANNPFGVYTLYLQTYFRVFFNLLKPVTEVIMDNYLFEHACKKVFQN